MSRSTRANAVTRAVDAVSAFVSRKNGFKSSDLRGEMPSIHSSPLVATPPLLSVVTSTTGGTLAASAPYWFYVVTATNASGETLPSVSNRVATTGSTSSAVVTWPVMPGATGYKVYRGPTRGGELLIATIGSGATNTYTDTGAAASAAVPTSNTTAPDLVTISGNTTSSPATGNTVTLSVLDAQKFRTYGAPLKLDVSNNVVPDYTITSSPPWFTDFYIDEAWFVTRTQGGVLTVLVDGKFLTAEPFPTTPSLPSDGNSYYARFEFPAAAGSLTGRKRRRVQIVANNAKFVSIIVPATATVQAGPKRSKVGLWVGDSITEPTIGENFNTSALTAISGTLQGSVFNNGFGFVQYLNFLFPDWDMRGAGSGGTGYINPNAGAGRVKAFDRLFEIVSQAADAIFHFNGINDGSYGYTPVLSEATRVFRWIKAKMARVEQWVIGPYWARQASSQSSGNLQVRDALEAAATAENLAGFVDYNDAIIPYGSTRPPVLGVLTASVAANANNFSSTGPIPPSTYVKIGSGELGNCDIVLTGGSTGTGPYTVSVSGGVMPSSHNANEPIRVYGPSATTGTGNQGSPSGLGNSDRKTCSDATHYTSGSDESGGAKETARRVAAALASIAPPA